MATTTESRKNPTVSHGDTEKKALHLIYQMRLNAMVEHNIKALDSNPSTQEVT